jgi:hypothetical protein
MLRVGGIVLGFVGLALLGWGVSIALGNDYDIGRWGAVFLGLLFIVPGAGLAIGGLVMIRAARLP